jgi:hypothetical protein
VKLCTEEDLTVMVCAALALSRLAINHASESNASPDMGVGVAGYEALISVQDALDDTVPAYLEAPLMEAIEGLARAYD